MTKVYVATYEVLGERNIINWRIHIIGVYTNREAAVLACEQFTVDDGALEWQETVNDIMVGHNYSLPNPDKVRWKVKPYELKDNAS